MELTARRYAIGVLLVHLLLLAAVVGLVYSAASETYRASRGMAIEQASRVQMLLAEQTQRGIETYYQSIVDTIELFKWTEDADVPGVPPLISQSIIAPSIWEQLRNRVSHFAGVNRNTGIVGVAYPAESRDALQQLVHNNSDWVRSSANHSLSPVTRMGSEDVNLVRATGPQGILILLAVVPVSNIEKLYLKNVYTTEMSAMVYDQDMRIVSAINKDIVGLSMISDPVQGNDRVREIARRYVQTGAAGTEIIEQPFRLGPQEFGRGIVSIRPMQVLDRRLWLTIASDLSSVELVLQTSFNDSLRWGIFLVVSMMAILASTSIWLIRSRVRVERMKRDVLTRELDEARKIQLAWLPRNDQDPQNLDLSAVNKPASHISGDFYNWFDLKDGRVCVVIGDVTGHGMAAAFLMATTQLLVRIAMPHAQSAGKCLEAVNHQLCKQVFSGQFVTMQLLVLDPARGSVELASAGHPPPLIWKNGSFKPMAMEPQLVLGIETGQNYTSQSFALERGAMILMYTDGVIEAKSPAGEWMGIDGLCDRLNRPGENAQALANEVIQAVDQFRGRLELADDLTLVAIHVDHSPKLPAGGKEVLNDPRA